MFKLYPVLPQRTLRAFSPLEMCKTRDTGRRLHPQAVARRLSYFIHLPRILRFSRLGCMAALEAERLLTEEEELGE
jgi:hypothetical protein